MSENDVINKRRTPLRNSNSADKPFRSPLNTILTPRNNESPNIIRQSPLAKSETPKRSISQFRYPIKRRRIENATDDDQTFQNSQNTENQCELAALKRRIRKKHQELDNLKTKLNYIKKHKKEDLAAQIDRWRSACKEALFQFHKDVRDTAAGTLTMQQVLFRLGIPEETVKFTPDECDLTQ